MVEAYKYSELSEKAKEKVREWFLDKYADPTLSDDLQYIFAQRLEQEGFPTDGIRWSLGYCQGSGCSFIGRVDILKYTTFHNLRGWGPLEEFALVEIRPRRDVWQYVHWNSVYVEMEEDTVILDEDPHPAEWWCRQYLKQLEEHIRDRVKEVNKELERMGYEETEARREDKYVDEEILANYDDLLFTEDGERIPI
jgi:hypothetical protein